MSLREIVEGKLIELFPNIVRPFSPDEGIVDRYKDGSFGVGNCSFALYSNGHNLRGESENKLGLIYEDGKTLFSIGYFRKEFDSKGELGYVTIVAPREIGPPGDGLVLEEFAQEVFQSGIPCKGIYARFLTLDQYKNLLNQGFLPIEEAPWHDDAPKEDETLNNSLLNIDEVLQMDNNGDIEKIKRLSRFGKNTSRKGRDSFNRFANFLKRSGLEYNLTQDFDENFAKEIINRHFEFLRKTNQPIGSTPQDHYGCMDAGIIGLDSVFTYLGLLDNKPVSLFVCEKVSGQRVAGYCGFTLRDPNLIDSDQNPIGFTAMPIYAYLRYFAELKRKGIDEVLLGGSEHRELNRVKRELGAKHIPSYWIVKLNNKKI